MRAVHIAAYHPAMDTRVFIKECRTLAAAGYDVHLMVAEPPEEPVIDGVTFHQIERPVHRHTSYWWPLLLWRPLWRIYKAALALDGDVYHLHESELIPVGLLLKLRGKRVIFDSHEDFPQQIFNMDTSRLLRQIYAHLMQVYLWLLMVLVRVFFDGAIVTVPKIACYFDPRKTANVYNYVRLDEYPSDPFATLPYAERQPRLFYIGGISHKRAAVEMVQAVGLLPESHAISFYLAGPMERSLHDELARLNGWERVEAPGRLPHDEMIPQMIDSKIGIVLLYPVSQYKIAFPTKLLEYMAVGLPVIVANLPNIREVIRGYEDCVLWVNPYDPQQIADAIMYLLDHPDEAEQRGRRGREAVETRLNWEAEAVKLLDLYARVAGKPQSAKVTN